MTKEEEGWFRFNVLLLLLLLSPPSALFISSIREPIKEFEFSQRILWVETWIGLWNLWRKDGNFGERDRNLEMDSSPFGGHLAQKRIYQVWRGNNVSSSLYYCSILIVEFIFFYKLKLIITCDFYNSSTTVKIVILGPPLLVNIYVGLLLLLWGDWEVIFLRF